MTLLAGQISPIDVADFLTAQGFPAKASFNGHLPPQPDELIVVAPTGGPGFTVEQLFDNVSFQLRTRGAQNDDTSAWTLAWSADRLLIPAPDEPPVVPGMIGSQYVNLISRVGGPPAFLLRDPGRRAHYTGNYIFSVARLAT